MFKRLSLIQKFLIALVTSLMLFGFAFGKIVSSLLEENLISRATEVTASFLEHEIEERFYLDRLTTPRNGADYEEVAMILDAYPLTLNAKQTKIWNKDFVVVWSENRDMVGQQFLGNDELKHSLRGDVVTEIIDHVHLEKKYRYPDDKSTAGLMELYIPFRLEPNGEVEVVFEIYESLDELYADIAHINNVVWASTLLGMGVLFLLLSWIVWGASKNIKSQHEEILRSKEVWAETFDTINDAITIHDSDFNILQANRGAEIMLGLPMLNISRKKCYESFHGSDCPPDDCPACNVLKTGLPSSTELYEPHLGKYVEIKALPRFDPDNKLIGIIHIVRDITNRKKTEQEKEQLKAHLLQAQKMESIGRLAGGVAHDFNNILSAITGYSEMALADIPEDHPVAEDLMIIKESADRAAALTNQLLAFSRKQVLEMKVMNINAVIDNLAKLLVGMLGEDIKLVLNTKTPVRNIIGDKGQIAQIIMNLTVNARDAMPRGGELTVETSNLEIDGGLAIQFDGAEPGPYVQLSVSDTGTGMTDEVKARIFEPFFTTKDVGKGTGLGLATVYGIVKQHNGYIDIHSEPGKGTIFSICLPVAHVDIKEQPVRAEGPTTGGTETVLIVEDDPTLLKLYAEVLQRLGYSVLQAPNGRNAVRTSRTHKGAIDLLLTDVVMPGMNGRTLADKFSAMRPDTKVIFMSGYSDESVAEHGVLDSEITLLQKPLTPTRLANKIREVLDKGPQTPPLNGVTDPFLTRPTCPRLTGPISRDKAH